MPLYEYHCDHCDQDFESLRSIKERDDAECPEGGGEMIVRTGRYGKFFACSGYPECKSTMNVGKDGKPVEQAPDAPTDIKCPKCGTKMTRQ